MNILPQILSQSWKTTRTYSHSTRPLLCYSLPRSVKFHSHFSNSATSLKYNLDTISTSKRVEDYEAFSLNGTIEDRFTKIAEGFKIRPKFKGNVFFLGCGAVSLCCLDIFERLVDTKWSQITVIDMLDLQNQIEPFLKKGVRFLPQHLSEENYRSIFNKYIKQGDLIIDLTVDSGSLDFMKWCHIHGVFYINSSVEAWHETNPSDFDPVKHCQFHEFDATELWKINSNKNTNIKTTIIYGLGANPGLVNLFCKQNLEDTAKYFLSRNNNSAKKEQIATALSHKNWSKLSQALGVKAIHVSELDTQQTAPENAKKPGECVNTWSIDGMYYECVFLLSEIGWGTHEKKLPKGAQHIQIEKERGLSHIILLPDKGKDAQIRSWVPGGEFIGHAITHEENYEITKDLTVEEGNMVLYRPTVNFAYRPSVACLESLEEISQTPGLALQKQRRILTSDIIKGRDLLGVLTMGHLLNGWWTGSLLDIGEARKLVGPRHNATTLQVAVGLMAGVVWMIKNPNAGILSATDLPHSEVLPVVLPLLGPFISIPVSWKPSEAKEGEEWQFHSLYIGPKNK